jgi:predicted nucleotidyltransferase component of viral defense system
MFLHKDKAHFKAIIENVAAVINVDESIVEKDYYVTLFLKRLNAKVPKLVFKGGTSLSKCYKLIERFSEDIDVNVDQTEKLTESGRRHFKDAVLETIEELGLTLTNPDGVRSRRDFNRYEIDFKSLFEGISVKQYLYLESAFRIDSFPTEKREASSVIADYLHNNGFDSLIEQYGLESFCVNVQTLDRTFIDKIFAICDYEMSGRIAEHSRHLYDLYKILPHIKIDAEFMELFKAVRVVRCGNATCPSASHDVNIPQRLRKLLAERTYQADYEKVTRPLLYEDVDYATVTATLEFIATELEDR